MEIPLSIIFYFYLFLIAVFFIFSFFNLYHLLRFGAPKIVTLVVTIFYLAVTAFMLVISLLFISTIDWQQSLQLIPDNLSQPFYD